MRGRGRDRAQVHMELIISGNQTGQKTLRDCPKTLQNFRDNNCRDMGNAFIFHVHMWHTHTQAFRDKIYSNFCDSASKLFASTQFA